MERRLKERLTGAVILVVVGVIVIPALLDGPDRQPPVSEALTLPVPPQQARTGRTINLGADPATAVTPAARTPQPPEATGPAARPPAATAPKAAAAQPKPASPAGRASADGPRASSAPPAIDKGWAVQVGSFSNETNARRLAETLDRAGYRAFVARHVVDGVVRFRVRVGPEPERESADALAVRLADEGQQTRVVPHP